LGSGGSVTITSQIFNPNVAHAYFQDANYGSGAATYLVPTGGFVSTGQIQAGTGTGTPISINGTAHASPVAAGSFGTGPTFNIIEIGPVLVSIAPGAFITPAEWIAYLQVASGAGQTLQLAGAGAGTGFATGGSFSINSANIPFGDFTSLVLPASVTVTVSAPTLTYSGSATTSGYITFTSASAQLNVGTTTNVAQGEVLFNSASGSIVGGGNMVFSSTTLSAGALTITGGGTITTGGFGALIANDGDLTVAAA